MDEPLVAQIEECMLADRFRLRQQARRLTDSSVQGDAAWQRLAERIAASRARRLERAVQLPVVKFGHDLPIHERLDEIRQAIDQHPVVIVCGETGSGKSTQLPKLCLSMGRGVAGLIGHTQPRRIAARSIAERLAQELGSTIGGTVGYKVRFTDATQPQTYIKLMTDGILRAETQNDRFLEQYDTLIIDEAHERSLNIDFLLGYLRRLVARRPELRVIVTSATIDVQRFSEYYATSRGPAPIIEVSGRTYPVEIRYRPVEAPGDEREPDLLDGVVAGVEECLRERSGDVLVFLPTERDIRDAAKTLRGAFKQRGQLEILPLYARLPTAEQQRIFQPHSQRRIVLATNVAESSLTVPNIHFVVDTGLARVSRYSPRSKVQRLPIEPVSRASADQRSGRCGRIAPGICVRLYAAEDYAARDQYATPEVRRTNLAAVILQTLALKLGSVEQFPFLDPPAPDKVRDGYATLFELGAIDAQRELTPLGQQLARLPVDPRIGRMVLAAQQEHCLAEVLIIAAALECQDPRERPPDKQEAADAAHARYADEQSDFLSYLKLWDFYHHLRETLSRSQLQKACRQNFLSLVRLREWADIYRQLLQISEQMGISRTARRDDAGAIHRALLTGLLSGVAYRGEGNEYNGAGGGKFVLWPGSHLFQARPPWVMAAELVETTRRYLRTVARIDPEWIEPIAEHLLKRSYSEPHWSSKRGEAMVYERVTLFGMPVVARRRTRLAPVEPEQAHEMFLRQALVAGDAPLKGSFLEHNQRVRHEVESLAAKTRRRDILLDEENCYRFYAQRVPADIADVATFDRWRKDVERQQPRLLYMSPADLLEPEKTEDIRQEQYPEQLKIDRAEVPLDYRFEPGEVVDGITITIPREGLATLQESQLEWLVPGFLEEKVLALIRSLPKQARRNFVPAPDAARRITQQLTFGSGPFLPTLAAVLSRDAGEKITPDMFRLDDLPLHLRMNVQVVDAAGKPLAAGRDLQRLRTELGVEASPSLAHAADGQWKRRGLRSWQWESLPEEVAVQSGTLRLTAYPTILDQGDSVALDLYASREAAEQAIWFGLRRLAMLEHHRALAEQVQYLPNLNQIELFGGRLATSGHKLRDDLALLICGRAFCEEAPVPRTADQYRRWLKQGKGRIPLAAQDVAKLALPLMEQYHHVRLALEKAPAPWRAAAEDMRRQLNQLVPPGFLTSTPWQWLQHFPRYLEAMRLRLQKLSGGLARDQQYQQQVQEFWQRWQQALETDPQRAELNSQLVLFRWMIEEFRVSLFAQQLGVSMPVSAKRLEKQWELVNP